MATADMMYCCKMQDLSDNEALLPEMFSAFEYDYNTWKDFESKETFQMAYFQTREDADAAKIEIEAQLEFWKDIGIQVGEIEVIEIKKEDWSEVWKRFFDIQHLGEKIVIRPSWLEYDEKDDDVVIDIDPGMSFGTGKHATTTFCLKMLERLTSKHQGESVLDAGSGSGILSIGAYKLGYTPVYAFDIDEESIVIAEENIEKNGIEPGEIVCTASDLAKYSPWIAQFDIVIANILFPVLLLNKAKLKSLVKPGGHLILAGILTTEYDKLKTAFIELGFDECYNETEKEWTGGLFLLK